MNYNKIKELLLIKRMSIPQLAEKIGMSKAGIYQAIDKKRLTVETLEKFAEVLDVPVTIFFDATTIEEIEYLKKELKNTKELNKALADSTGLAENEIINKFELLQSKRAILRLVYSRIKQTYSRYYDLFSNQTRDDIDPDYEKLLLFSFKQDTMDCYDEILKAINEAENFEGTKSKKKSTESGLELSSTSIGGKVTDITVSKVKPAEDEHLTRLEKLQKIQNTISQMKVNDLNTTSTKKEIISEIDSIIEDLK